MFYTFGAEQSIRDFFHDARLAFDHQHLQTVVMVEVDMHGGEDVVKIGMLEIGKFFVQHTYVVVVEQRYSPNYITVRALPRFFDQFIANQIAKCLGTVGVTPGSDQVVKLFQKVGIDGYANPAKLAHGYSQE